jgi:RNA polymerase sigma-70 factor (ECF subfamily)
MANPNSEWPRLADDPLAWQSLVEAAGPAMMLVRIESRMSGLLRRRLSAEDIWQETLLHAWRDRGRHHWTGPQGFRGWIMEIAENRLRDAADRESAEKRGGGRVDLALARPGSEAGVELTALVTTTPSRMLAHRELAECMQAALEGLPDDLREVVRLRLFEEQGIEAIAASLGLTPAAAKHRLRKGSALYGRRLQEKIGTRGGTLPEKG